MILTSQIGNPFATLNGTGIDPTRMTGQGALHFIFYL